jgi:glycosyltransferase involved in cell wall biosynthesis
MNVLQLTLGFSPSGRSRAIRTLSEGLRAYGVRSSLGCLEEIGPAQPADLSPYDELVELRRHEGNGGVCIRRIVRLCDDRSIDLIHAHDAASQWMAVSVRRRRPRVKLVMTFHRSLGFESARRRDRVRNAVAGVFTAAIVVGSRERRRHYMTENMVPPRKVVRIPFGIDLARFRRDVTAREQVRSELGVSPETVLFGCVGHFGSVKGIDVAIEGFARHAQRSPKTPSVLAVFGTGNPEDSARMRTLAERASPGRVLFCGFRCNIERFFAGLDAFVHTPRLEAFGLVMIEAMATGLPVVATSVGGIPDIVLDRETGLLVPSENSDRVADALAELGADTRLRDQWGRQAQELASTQYGADLFARRHAGLYRDVIHGVGPTGVGTEHIYEPIEQLSPDTDRDRATTETASCLSK